SGPQIHNLQLSFRRAQSVAESLLASGVARERVYIRAVGESELRVRTGDGVREPQNRRVEIRLM
ncbi:MAG: OmpA family protein, partial [Tagaea sp.]